MGNTLDKPETEKTTERNSPATGTAVRPHIGLDDSALTWGASCMQGWRRTMEDAYHCHTIESCIISVSSDACLRLPSLVSVEYELPFPHYLFSVFDGHGGTFAAEFANENLLRVLKQQDSFQQYVALVGTPAPRNAHANSRSKTTARGKNTGRGARRDPKRATNTNNNTREQSGIDLIRDALETAFMGLDWELLTALRSLKDAPDNPDEPAAHLPKDHSDGDAPSPPSESGTTATVVLITPDWIVCANTGDSRAVLYACNASSGTIPLSVDHTPDLPEERERIERANGTVTSGRVALVDGRLQMSRALGDFDFKGVSVDTPSRYSPPRHAGFAKSDEWRHAAKAWKVTPFPQVVVRQRDRANDLCLVVASDGIWDVFSNEECRELMDTLVVREGESDAGLIAEEVLDVSLKKGSRDNMTICVVQFPAQLKIVGKGGGVARRRKRRA